MGKMHVLRWMAQMGVEHECSTSAHSVECGSEERSYWALLLNAQHAPLTPSFLPLQTLEGSNVAPGMWLPATHAGNLH